MKRPSLPAIAWAVVVVAACGASGFGARRFWTSWRVDALAEPGLDPSDPAYQDATCGPAGLSVALGRLGVVLGPSEIASRCRVTPRGVALADLERAASGLPGVRAAAGRLGWDDLRALDGVAVLFVGGDHYVAVDPREAAPEALRGPAIRVYDREVPARWHSRAELEGVWSGEALALTRRRDAPGKPGGPRIAWEESYLDRGVLAGAPAADFRFSLRNEGGEDLVIEGVATSCGCMSHRLSSARLAPGESARLEVVVNLDGKEGYVRQTATVRSNDPSSPSTTLTMTCGVPRKSAVSSRAIRLETLPRGGRVRREFVVGDPGFAGIEIREARFLPLEGSRMPDGLSCSIAWEAVGGDARAVGARTGFPASPGDRLVRLSFEAAEACPVGPFEGHVAVTVEAGGSSATHRIAVQGVVEPDVRAIPQMALITLGPDPDGVGRAVLRLRGRVNPRVRVVRAWSDSPRSLEVGPEGGPGAAGDAFVVTARVPGLAEGSAPFRGTALFELEGGSVVPVPVTVFRPPRGAAGPADGAPAPAPAGRE